ncbi:MAG: response regulator [Ardenticatenales bacterium]|nr:response regulator [Ardenticatenales bacterium]
MSLLKRLGSRPPEESGGGGTGASESSTSEAAPLHLLLIEDNMGEARLLREMLAEIPGTPFHLTHVDRLSAALKRLDSQTFDLILSDLTLPDSDGMETFLGLHAHSPEIPIVVLSGLDDVRLAVRAVQQGAQDYLFKGQVMPLDLVRALYAAIEQHKVQREQARQAQPGPSGKLVACLGAKGGMGTTTVALNLAAAQAGHQSTLAVELRYSLGSFALQLQQTPLLTLNELLTSAAPRLTERELRQRVVRLPSGVGVLFGPQKVGDCTALEPKQVTALLPLLKGMAQCVVMDVEYSPTQATQTVLQGCDLVLLIVEPEPVAVAASRAMLEFLATWGISGSLVAAVILNRAAASGALKPHEVQAHLGCPLLGIVPPAVELCMMATRQGVPLVLGQPTHIAAQSLIEVANKLRADALLPLKL